MKVYVIKNEDGTYLQSLLYETEATWTKNINEANILQEDIDPKRDKSILKEGERFVQVKVVEIQDS